MAKQYYAAYMYMPDEIAVFTSRRERDKWVRCEDWFSKEFPPLDKDRVALTRVEAISLVGLNNINDRNTYTKDAFLDDVSWIVVAAVMV